MSKKARSLRNTEEEWTAGGEDVKRSDEEPVPEEPEPPEPAKISKKKPVRLPKVIDRFNRLDFGIIIFANFCFCFRDF